MGPTLADFRLKFKLHPREYAVLAQYNDRPDELRCPFFIMFPEAVDADPIEARMVTPPCLCSHPRDVLESYFG